MNKTAALPVYKTHYDADACRIGVVHLGYGAFHRAHQAVYFDDYMEKTGDLSWGIAAVNLRASEAAIFAQQKPAYILKSVSPQGRAGFRQVRSHIAFKDWSQDAATAEDLLSLPSVHMLTITVTEGGYYTDPAGMLNLQDETIKGELQQNAPPRSVYGYLMRALDKRRRQTGAPLSVCCCDNIRRNGKILAQNFMAYLDAAGQKDLLAWVKENVAFPCSMVDRITPRAQSALDTELSILTGGAVRHPVMSEEFTQWVLEDHFTAPVPDLGCVGVTVTQNVDPFEETKIRVLNGGHTCLAYLAALEGVQTFDRAMAIPHLLDHFMVYQTQEVLPALTTKLPFSKQEYLQQVTERFQNVSIADTVARICTDGMAKFPLFIRPTLEECLQKGIMPRYGLRSVASWYVFVRHVAAGKISFEYTEPAWDKLHQMLQDGSFVTAPLLWGDLPTKYPQFTKALQQEITRMEQEWPL